jgi:hypothetical protein
LDFSAVDIENRFLRFELMKCLTELPKSVEGAIEWQSARQFCPFFGSADRSSTKFAEIVRVFGSARFSNA